jgi:hypothetical protein
MAQVDDARRFAGPRQHELDGIGAEVAARSQPARA